MRMNTEVTLEYGEELKKQNQLLEVWKSLRKNRLAVFGLVVTVILILVAIFADVIAPYDPDSNDLTNTFCFPCAEHPFGTDNMGRDQFSRIVYGARISLLVGISTSLIGMVGGIIFGSIAGYYGARTDTIIMRIMDVFMAIPSTLLAMSVMAVLGEGVRNTILAIGVGSIPKFSRVVRSAVLGVKGNEYVEAAHAIGASDFRIITKYIIANSLAPIIVQTTMNVASAILAAASLSFIGLGVQPPTAEWGSMLSASRPYIRDYGFLVLYPGLAIMATIFGLNLFGDGLRDALDPRLKN
ncbi:MAG: ABC transporter permease [bacterium]|nr:ABC transporter permease [bacterium]